MDAYQIDEPIPFIGRYEARPHERTSDKAPLSFGLFDTFTQTWVVGMGPFNRRDVAGAAVLKLNQAYERTLSDES